MTSAIVIGTHFGDEGKGKIVDYFTRKQGFDVIVRYNGGGNAGHTVVLNGDEIALHLIPSGIPSGKIGVITGGVVVDPKALMNERLYLQERKINLEGKLFVDGTANLVLPHHRVEDYFIEIQRGKNRRGTTGRGIGPAYSAMAARESIRVYDLVDFDRFREMFRIAVEREHKKMVEQGMTPENLQEILEQMTKVEQKANAGMLQSGILRPEHVDFTRFYRNGNFNLEEMLDDFSRIAAKLKPFVADTSLLLTQFIVEGKKVLFEGAQGTFLNVNMHPPYVTSSYTTAGGAALSGIPLQSIDRVIGVTKAYTTRVGSGPFPTKIEDKDLQQRLREQGGEFGATTGRPRDCGWLDLPMLRRAILENGMTELAMTKLDVLSRLNIPEIPVCIAYEINGFTEYIAPKDTAAFAMAKPIYSSLPSWSEDISSVRAISGLPKPAREYAAYLELLVNDSHIPLYKNNFIGINLISVGKDSESTIKV